MDVNGHAVAVGDWLRCFDDGWEGRVVDTDATTATLAMNDGNMRAATADQLYWNWWSPNSVVTP